MGALSWKMAKYTDEIMIVAQSPDELARGQIIVRESSTGNDSKNIRPRLDDRLEQLKFTESTWRTCCRQSRNPGYGISHARGHRGNYAWTSSRPPTRLDGSSSVLSIPFHFTYRWTGEYELKIRVYLYLSTNEKIIGKTCKICVYYFVRNLVVIAYRK